jgi:hypothetical protein
MELKDGLTVALAFGVHAVQEAEFIDVFGNVGEQLRNPGTAFAVLLELPEGLHELLADGGAGGRLERQILAIVLDEAGFVVERIDLGGAAVHEQEDDAFGARRMVRRFGGQGILLIGLGREAGECKISKARSGGLQELSAAYSLEHASLLNELTFP